MPGGLFLSCLNLDSPALWHYNLLQKKKFYV